MSVAAVFVALTLHLSGPKVTGWSLDITPVVEVTADYNKLPFFPASSGGLSPVPGLILISPQTVWAERFWPGTTANFVREELRHQQQMQALGPWFYVAYAATAGKPFEPYAYAPVDYYHSWADLSAMWMPPPALQRRCPVFRITDHSASFMPCYEIVRIGVN